MSTLVALLSLFFFLLASNSHHFIISYDSVGQEFSQDTPRTAGLHVMYSESGPPKMAFSLMGLMAQLTWVGRIAQSPLSATSALPVVWVPCFSSM